MKKEYDVIINSICNLPSWTHAEGSEKDGAIGVACMIAFMRHVKPTLSDMSNHLDISPHDLEKPFKRLSMEGVFATHRNAQKDKIMLGEGEDIIIDPDSLKIKFPASDRTRNAWCFIAGIASGFIGIYAE